MKFKLKKIVKKKIEVYILSPKIKKTYMTTIKSLKEQRFQTKHKQKFINLSQKWIRRY